MAIKVYVGKSKIIQQKEKNDLLQGMNLEPLVFNSDAFLTQLTWLV